MAFVDLLGFTSETLGVDIIAVSGCFDFSVSDKSPTSIALGLNKKNRRRCAEHRNVSAPPAAICDFGFVF
jgi:hypothetical protein